APDCLGSRRCSGARDGKPGALFKPNKIQYPAIIATTIPSSDELGRGCHGLRHERSDEVEGRDAAPAATPRNWAAARQRGDDSTDKDDREQLVYRRTRQPGTLRQSARLNEEKGGPKTAHFLFQS